MKDFVVLFKPLKINQLTNDRIHADTIDVNYLMEQTYRDHPNIRNYEIDKDSIRFETIENRLCVVFLAFKK